MLMRFAKVTKDGTYIPPPAANSKASYATMVFVRATIVRDAGDFLSRAVTIATRYTAVRRQSSPTDGGRELQIIDYDNVRQTLLPLVAQSYALKFMGKRMMKLYHEFDAARDKGDFSSLPELHALSSGLKSLCTDLAASGIETCRRTCGGQGYSVLSGLPSLYASYVQNVTWEGDNNVMYLQTARFVVKTVVAAMTRNSQATSTGGESEQQRTRQGSAAYLQSVSKVLFSRCSVSSTRDWSLPEHSLSALRYVASRLAVLAVQTLKDAAGVSDDRDVPVEGDPWNASTVDLIRAARAHCSLYLHQSFIESIVDAEKLLSKSALEALHTLASLHGIVLLEDFSSVLLEDGYADGQQTSWLRRQRRNLTLQVRPNAVALVDAFGYDDYLLNSCIGRRDGDVYRALLEAARTSPLNATQEGPAWEPVLKSLLSPSVRQRSRL